MMLTGLMSAAVHLDNIENLEQLMDKIGDAATNVAKNVWIIGSYLNEQNITEKRMPTRIELDRVCPDHPIFLRIYKQKVG